LDEQLQQYPLSIHYLVLKKTTEMSWMNVVPFTTYRIWATAGASEASQTLLSIETLLAKNLYPNSQRYTTTATNSVNL
jgi:hypothetical protein